MATTQSLCQRKPSPAAVAKPLPSNRVENEKMKRIKAKFQVVTPCFLGGANHDEEANLRLPSIKGALRFWWRALNYAQITTAEQKKNNGIIASLREKEGKLFGSSEQDKGQSLLIMRLNAESQKSIGELKETKDKSAYGMRYLGYGVMDFKGQLTRPCLSRGKDSFYPFEFTLQIGAKEQKHLDKILPALKLFGLLGGLGSKSRKGYGSLNLIELKGDGVGTWQTPASENDYEERLTDLLKPTSGNGKEGPEISRFLFQHHIRFIKLKRRNSAMSVLNQYGEEMIRYRSWGRNGKILDGEDSEKNFKDDHDWAKAASKGMKPPPHLPYNFHPRRAVFGLPHNYGKGVGVKPENHERRASPLFFHVHKIGSKFVGVALLLCSQFLPPKEMIKAGKKTVPANPDWKVLTDFLDRICDKTIWP